MLTEIAVWPSVKSAVMHRGEVIGDQVGPDLVAFVDNRPKLARLGLEGDPRRVAQPRGIDPLEAGTAVHLPDRSAAFLDRDSVFGDVAVRSDAGVELRSIRADGQTLGPMMVD